MPGPEVLGAVGVVAADRQREAVDAGVEGVAAIVGQRLHGAEAAP